MSLDWRRHLPGLAWTRAVKEEKGRKKDRKLPLGQKLSKKDGKGRIFRKRTEKFSVLFLKPKRTGFVKSGLQKGQMATLWLGF